jgi:hypothetical protein
MLNITSSGQLRFLDFSIIYLFFRHSSAVVKFVTYLDIIVLKKLDIIPLVFKRSQIEMI